MAVTHYLEHNCPGHTGPACIRMELERPQVADKNLLAHTIGDLASSVKVQGDLVTVHVYNASNYRKVQGLVEELEYKIAELIIDRAHL